MPFPTRNPPPYDPAELAEEVDLDPEKKRRIIDLHVRLEDLSYYELLGVPLDADKKAIKAAYYKLAPEFHPDSYFRKNLGSFKPRIEAIFTRVTLAHDVLTAKQRRAEYDAYLDQSIKNRSIVDALTSAEEEARAAMAAIEQTAMAAAPVDGGSTIPRAPLAPSFGPEAGRPSGMASTLPQQRQSLSPEQRREILARKLAGQSFGRIASRPRMEAPPPSNPPPVANSAEAQSAAAQTLKARYEAAKVEALRSRISGYQKVAEEAIQQGDFAKAANSYRIAVHLAPDDEALKLRCEEVQRMASATLAAGYPKQAAYEENEGRWADASLSYARAAEGRADDAFAHERAAFTTIKAGGSARRAVDYARRAVELAPQNPDNHITLARSYLSAGFGVSALGELDRALAAGPLDAKHKEVVSELRDQAHRLNKLG